MASVHREVLNNGNKAQAWQPFDHSQCRRALQALLTNLPIIKGLDPLLIPLSSFTCKCFAIGTYFYWDMPSTPSHPPNI
jgi:hypothetical protein